MDIPRQLHRIVRTEPESAIYERVFEHRSRCKTLLDTWAPHLLLDMRKNRRWARRGEIIIYYVPENSGA